MKRILLVVLVLSLTTPAFALNTQLLAAGALGKARKVERENADLRAELQEMHISHVNLAFMVMELETRLNHCTCSALSEQEKSALPVPLGK